METIFDYDWIVEHSLKVDETEIYDFFEQEENNESIYNRM